MPLRCSNHQARHLYTLKYFLNLCKFFIILYFDHEYNFYKNDVIVQSYLSQFFYFGEIFKSWTKWVASLHLLPNLNVVAANATSFYSNLVLP